MDELNSSTLMSEDIENEEEETSEEITQEEVNEEGAETVNTTEESTTEEQPEGKYYTDEEFNKAVNEIADRRVARKMRKLERELDKYKDTERVLQSQIGGENIGEINTKLRKMYEDEGITLPERYISEDKDYIEYQANKDSEDIISEGMNAVNDEASRLANIGYDNLSAKDKMVFTNLVNAMNKDKEVKELRALNIDTNILEDKDFIEYRGQFNSNVPVSKIYDMFTGTKETKVQTPGSLKNTAQVTSEYFTDEEIEALTDEQLDDPIIWEKVRKSQTRKK